MISQNYPHNSMSSQHKYYQDNKNIYLLWNISHHLKLLGVIEPLQLSTNNFNQ